MKSGLEDRNNRRGGRQAGRGVLRLNEVRPGRPEQSELTAGEAAPLEVVSMKSGLEDRNNADAQLSLDAPASPGLNEVRPGRPEQLSE